MKGYTFTQLKNPYISVDGSFGGNQDWLENIDSKKKGKTLRGFGCGLVGASDILMYIMGGIEGVTRNIKDTKKALDKKDTSQSEKNSNNLTDKNNSNLSDKETGKNRYVDYLRLMEKKYFHILPYLGISGVLLAWNMNLYFLLHRKQIKETTGHTYRAGWFVRPSVMLDRIREMLTNDIPVILAIGPGFFHKKKVTFYRKEENGNQLRFKPLTKTKDHYVTVTGLMEVTGNVSNTTKDNDVTSTNNTIMLEISSWGKKYYVNYDEYRDYVKKCDNYYFSNILYIRRK